MLSPTQEKVMGMLGRKHIGYQQAPLESVEINGAHMCNMSTIRSLQKLGLVYEKERLQWAATPIGRQYVLG